MMETEDIVAHVREWSLERAADMSIPKDDARAILAEFYEWIEPEGEEIERTGRQNFSRTILSLHKTAGKTNYEETRQLFTNNVLTESLDNGVPKYYNSNILSRYFRKDYYETGD